MTLCYSHYNSNDKLNGYIFFIFLTFFIFALFFLYTSFELVTKDDFNTSLISAYIRDNRLVSALLELLLSGNYNTNFHSRYIGLLFYSISLSLFVFSISTSFFIDLKNRVIFSSFFVVLVFSNCLLYIYISVFWTVGIALVFSSLAFHFFKYSLFSHNYRFLYLSSSAIFCSLILFSYQLVIFLPIVFCFLYSLNNNFRYFLLWFFLFSILSLSLVVFLRSNVYFNLIGEYSGYRSAVKLIYTQLDFKNYVTSLFVRQNRFENIISYNFIFSLALVFNFCLLFFVNSIKEKLTITLVITLTLFIAFNPLILMNASFNARAYATVVSFLLVVLLHRSLISINLLDENKLLIFFIFFCVVYSFIAYKLELLNVFILVFFLTVSVFLPFKLILSLSNRVIFLFFLLFSTAFLLQNRVDYISRFSDNYQLSNFVINKINYKIVNLKSARPHSLLKLNIYYGKDGRVFYNMLNDVSGPEFFKHKMIPGLIDYFDFRKDNCPIVAGFKNDLFDYNVVKDDGERLEINLCLFR